MEKLLHVNGLFKAVHFSHPLNETTLCGEVNDADIGVVLLNTDRPVTCSKCKAIVEYVRGTKWHD